MATTVERLARAEEEISALDRHKRKGTYPLHTEALGQIYDCRVLIIDKHNLDFPAEEWSATDSDIRDRIAGKPDAARIARAESCAASGGIIEY